MTTSVAKGKQYEAFALAFLTAKGLRLVAKNYTVRFGEIDLIMRENDTLVFVEVRMRKTSQFARAEETISRHKQMKLIKTAQCFLNRHPNFQDYPCRFDIIALNESNQPEWIQQAFTL